MTIHHGLRRILTSEWLSWQPRVCLFEGFLSQSECQELIRVAKRRLEPCRLSRETTGVTRTARGCWLPRGDAHSLWPTGMERAQAVVAAIEDRIAHATAIPASHGEPCQLLYYSDGDEYSLHPDAFDPSDRGALRNGGQRHATFLAYLNSVPEAGGGATLFPEALGGRLRVQPEACSALLWHNTLCSGSVDMRSVHAGSPVRRGHEKWVLSKWLRARPFRVDEDAFKRQGWHRE